MSYASSASSLIELIQAMERRGYVNQMRVSPGGLVNCRACGATEGPAHFAIDDQRRTEGASDPADMALAVALRCPRCGAAGTLAVKYGPYASADEAEVLRNLDGDHLPPPGRESGAAP